MLNGFEPWFERFTLRMERFLIKTVVFGLVLLVVVQVALTNDTMRAFMNNSEKIAGVDQETASVLEEAGSVPAMAGLTLNSTKDTQVRSKGQIMLKLHTYTALNYVKVIVNDKVVGTFNQNPIMVEVKDGDIVQIDGSAYQMPLTVEVIKVSDKIVSPSVGCCVKTKGNTTRLGCILIDEAD